MAPRRSGLLILAVALLPQTIALGEDTKPAVPDTSVAAAGDLYRAGKFAEAETAYEALVKADWTNAPAQAGLVRSMLRRQKIDESLEAVDTALGVLPNSAVLLAVKGDVQFRRGEMADAEASYLAAKKLDPKEAHAYLGLAQLYSTYSLYRRAYEQLQRAHEIAPSDIEVQGAWLNMLPRKERLAAIEAYLAGPHPDDAEETKLLEDELGFLRATVDKPTHACKLVSKVERTETKLEVILREGHSIRGLGLAVGLNGHNARLLLDTGAGGIIVSSKVAEKARLTRISPQHYGGIGDKGLQSGYTAVADSIHVGELEFRDCVVTVTDKRALADDAGLIGADVFGAYLIDIDLPGMRLKLSPLPKRPEDATASTSLNSEGEQQANAEEKEDASEQAAKDQKLSEAKVQPAPRLPRDRYIAPEMATWTKVFRFGHTILVPTMVNEKVMLFGLDTGASNNILSLRAGRQVTYVVPDETVRMRGVSGKVSKVFSASVVNLRFGPLQQDNFDIITLDLSTVSRYMGTEVSGFLGFRMLRLLELKLDYRDGLVDFVYDPKRVPVALRCGKASGGCF